MASQVAPAVRQLRQARPGRGCALEGTARSRQLSAVSRRDTRASGQVQAAWEDAVALGLEEPATGARCPEDAEPGREVHVQGGRDSRFGS